MLLFLSSVGCESPADSWPNLITETSESSYAFANQVDIEYSVTNAGTSTYQLHACADSPFVGIEMHDAGRWTLHHSTMCIAVLPMTPIAVLPDESLEFVVTARPPAPGAFRLRLSATHSPQESLDASAVSNVFWIR